MRRPQRLHFFLVGCCLAATLAAQLGGEREARAEVISVWGQLHGGYVGGTSDRFDEGNQGMFGFAAGFSLAMVDIFTDVRIDKFDLDRAGMWNQIGVGVSFGLPVPYVEPFFGMRAAYLFAQYSEGARAAYQRKLEVGERDSTDVPQKGLNVSGQIGANVELIGPLYFTIMADLGYHVLLPEPTNSMGLNFTGMGGLKLKFGL